MVRMRSPVQAWLRAPRKDGSGSGFPEPSSFSSSPAPTTLFQRIQKDTIEEMNGTLCRLTGGERVRSAVENLDPPATAAAFGLDQFLRTVDVGADPGIDRSRAQRALRPGLRGERLQRSQFGRQSCARCGFGPVGAAARRGSVPLIFSPHNAPPLGGMVRGSFDLGEG